MSAISEKIQNIVFGKMKETGVTLKVTDLSIGQNKDFIIEPIRYDRKDLDGMQINYFSIPNIFEVSEICAGKNENELHVLYESKSLKRALNNMFKGNKNRKPMQIWA